MTTLDHRIADIVLRNADAFCERPGEFGSKPAWAALSKTGSRLWLDTGDIDDATRLWSTEFSGLTTNNSSLNAEVQKGIYDALIGEVGNKLADRVAPRRAVVEIAFVLNAVHGLRLARRFGANVSVELHTDTAHDVDAAVAYGRRFNAVCPERFIVKVPMTPAGFLAARRLSDDGIPVNFTVGFSARQNFLATVLARPRYVNVFVLRISAFVEENGLGDRDAALAAGIRAGRASQRAVREANCAVGAAVKQIMASMRDTALVTGLAGVDVQTLNPGVVEEIDRVGIEDKDLVPRLDAVPEVLFKDGVDAEAIGFSTLWDVPESFRAAALELAGQDLAGLDSEAIQTFFARRDCPGILPKWSPQDVALAKSDGKIPMLDHWRERLAAGEVGLDALMNLSVLMAFITDQEAMDRRIAGLIGSDPDAGAPA